jgi:putative ABC transport system permease protein
VEFAPIIAALGRNRAGVLFVVLQIALTVAIVCNSLSIIQQQRQRMGRPSGLDEADIFAMQNRWTVGTADLAPLIRGDVAALRTLPGVIDAVAINSYPLRGYGLSWGVALNSGQKQLSVQHVAVYMGGAQALATFGVRLVAGRWFTAEEISNIRIADLGQAPPPVMVITQALARSLFPAGDAVGRTVYLNVDSRVPTRIIGIVQRTQAPWVEDVGFADNSSMFWPYRYVGERLVYLVRTQPGRLDAVMRIARSKLFSLSSARVIDEVQTIAEARAQMYRSDRALAVTLAALSVLLLAVTGCGIVGMTAYWVAQRRGQIGIRRALGARRVDILRYFHGENLLIAGGGAVIGIALGVGLNLWLAASVQIARVGVGFVCAGAIVVLCLSQAAVLWPALRAASVPPAEATRSV